MATVKYDEYIDQRNALFEKIKLEQETKLKQMPRRKINVTLPDGSVKEATSYETSAYDIISNISKSLADKAIVSKVNDKLYDLNRPLEEDCTLKVLTFDDQEGKMVFWHSSAHVLGEACELNYQDCKLCIGPPIEEGFYYEMFIGDPSKEAKMGVVSQEDYPKIETKIKDITKENQKFERLELTKEQLLEMFKYNQFKQHLISTKIKDGESTTVYRCGKLIDLCRGPHVLHTGKIKALALLKNSSSYFLGDSTNKTLQRLYGISFPDQKKLKEYLKFLEEAKSRDHRKIGKEQELFFFNDYSPGSCFFLPKGAYIYNKLMEFVREQYRTRGFQEVVTPNIYDIKLWETSGHWQNYQENMFSFDVEKTKYALKPMNCPGHCLMFRHLKRSYKELPVRFADFGVLHRNEYSGALSGLTRVRRFQQDDAHIFCSEDQIEKEILGCFDFIKTIYSTFGFTFELKLSTRPESFIGDIEVWNNAEKQLENALNQSGYEWRLDEGDGAFYGPKIDISISDALRRKHQCATIQLDFQLPKRFELTYRTDEINTEKDNQETGSGAYKAPVIIHRAIYGSFERIIAILTENFAGKWPLWLSPNGVLVIPVAHAFDEYASKVHTMLREKGVECELDKSDLTLNKKIRNGELAHYNFILVVGQEEMSAESVNVRNRDDPSSKKKGEKVKLDDFINRCLRLIKNRAIKNTD